MMLMKWYSETQDTWYKTDKRQLWIVALPWLFLTSDGQHQYGVLQLYNQPYWLTFAHATYKVQKYDILYV